jgi:signal transduction histidine kinase
VTERKEAQQELERLTTRLLHAQDEERRRIAQGLHEQSVQTLIASTCNLFLLQVSPGLDAEARQLIRESLEMGRQAIEELRTLAYVLHPPVLDAVGMTAALTRYVRGFRRRSGIAVEVSIAPALPRLPQDVQTALYRVVQESLTNIQRHAESERAWIRLEWDGDWVVLEVQDQGRGLAAGGSRTSEDVAMLGIGIAGMRERMRQLGGYLDLTSSPEGTTVTAVAPSHAYAAERSAHSWTRSDDRSRPSTSRTSMRCGRTRCRCSCSALTCTATSTRCSARRPAMTTSTSNAAGTPPLSAWMQGSWGRRGASAHG